MVLTQNMRDFDDSFFIVNSLICMVAITGSRFAERTLLIGTQSVRDRTARRTLIVGAGRTGRSLMRELRETAGERVVDTVDDNPISAGAAASRDVKIVLGSTSELARVLERTEPDIVLITIPDAPREILDALVETCTEAGVTCRFVRREIDLDPRVGFGAASEMTRPVSSVSVSTTGRERQRTLVDRVLAVFPALVIALVIFVFYAVEAWSRKTPWIFTDELEWTQISRSIASTGHAARRGDPLYFKSLYAYLIAPAWWIHSTSAAYSAIKYLNAFIMPLAAIPTYLLARMLVTKRAAVVVAIGSVAVPAMAYVTSIVTDVLAYPYFALCSWLSVRALKEGKRRDVIIAAVFLAGGYFIRQRQFTTLPIAFVIAAAGLWFTGPRGKGVRRNWTTSDKLGALALAIGVAILFQPLRAPARPGLAAPDAVLQEPALVDYGLRGRPLARDRPRRPAGDRRPHLASAARAARRSDLPRLRCLDCGSDRRSRRLRSGQGNLALTQLRNALGGARPDLPVPAPAARHGDGVPGQTSRLASRRRGDRIRPGDGRAEDDPAPVPLLRGPRVVDPGGARELPALDRALGAHRALRHPRPLARA